MGPSHETIELADAYLAHARWWLPASPRGCVLYLHGIESHGGWFESSAARLAEAGFAVLLPDRRGSGQNHLERGHARSAGQLLQDVKLQARLLLDRTGFQRAHLLGVSWGGKLAAAAMVRWPALFGSLTLVTPGLFARVHLPGRDRLRVIWSALMARKRRFALPLDDPALFTTNPPRMEFIRTDPLRLRHATAALLVASRHLDLLARMLPRRCPPGPVHLFLAGRDRIIDNEPTRQFVRRLTGTVRAITEYRHASHSLEFEPQPEQFFDDLVACLQQANSQTSTWPGPITPASQQ